VRVDTIVDSTTIIVEPFGMLDGINITDITDAKIFSIESVRFATLTDFNNYTPENSYLSSDIFFIDDINSKYAIIDQNENIIRSEAAKVDYSQFVNASVLTDDNIKLIELDVYHPNVGKLP
jgi:hypothetical protein